MIKFLTIPYFIVISALWGIMRPASCVNILIAFELALLGCGLNYVLISLYLDDILGQSFAVIMLSVAGAESALGLAVLVAYFRKKGDILTKRATTLKS